MWLSICVCSSSQLWWRWSIWVSVWLRHQWPLCGSGRGSLSQSEWADMKQFWGNTQTNNVCGLMSLFIRFVHVYFLACRGVTQNCYAYFITFLQMQHTFSHLQLYLCGQMTSSTLSMTWCPTLSILLRCWLIMFLKASFKWRQISVSFTGPKTRFLSVVFLHCSVGYISL